MQTARPCRGLVLAGGGARGSYQVGVWRALDEMGWTAGVVTGTSVGCLNGAIYVLGQYETARDMWLSIRSGDIMELPAPGSGLEGLGELVRQLVTEGGLDVSPLESIVRLVLDEDALRASPIRFGLVTVEKRGLRPRQLTLEEIPRGKVADYLLASAAFFPAMQARTIDGVAYMDGGYADNMPAGLAARLGAEELVCVDLEGLGITRPNRTGLPTTRIRSHWELGDILRFDPAVARRNIELGYYDTLRAFGRLRGDAYPVALASSAEAAADFRARFDPLQEAVKGRWPAAHLPAALALAWAGLQDGPLAPLEAAAEEAGVDPARLYTVGTLGEAFLAACDEEKLAPFDPLFEAGGGTPALAARAAVQPRLFLQALVRRALTGPLVPEVIG